MTDPLDLIGEPEKCDTCGTVIEHGAICKTCQREAEAARANFETIDREDT